MAKKRVLVIGLDGFTWKTLDYLKGQLEMKNLEKIRDRSAWARLESTLPTNTIPAWISFATGCNPGKHGVFDFIKPDGNLSNLRPINSKDIRVDTIQQILNRHGFKSIIDNLPGSTPALTEDITLGNVISSEQDKVSPKSAMEIAEVAEYALPVPQQKRMPNVMVEDRGDVLERLLENAKLRKKVGKRLFREKWDFYFFMFSETDMLQHLVFDEIKNNSMTPSIRKHVLEIYREIDEMLGWFMDNVDNNTHVILVSDHGFDAYGQTFCLKNFLREKGLLKYYNAGKEIELDREKKVHKKDKANLNIASMVNLMYGNSNSRRVLDFARDVYLNISKVVPVARFVNISGFRMRVDPCESLVMPITVDGYAVYINRKSRFGTGVSDEDAKKLELKVIELLKNEISPFTGKPTFKWVGKAGEVYSGDYVKEGPDILMELKDHAIIGDAHYADVYYRGNKNYHDKYGIFTILGPGIKNGKISDKKLIDLAPLVLHLLDLAVPSHMDGKVMSEIFEGNRDIKKVNSESIMKLKERIRKMRGSMNGTVASKRP
jgi:predicted AlkP superfamily phosphohydrolase/phosphomutase